MVGIIRCLRIRSSVAPEGLWSIKKKLPGPSTIDGWHYRRSLILLVWHLTFPTCDIRGLLFWSESHSLISTECMGLKCAHCSVFVASSLFIARFGFAKERCKLGRTSSFFFKYDLWLSLFVRSSAIRLLWISEHDLTWPLSEGNGHKLVQQQAPQDIQTHK